MSEELVGCGDSKEDIGEIGLMTKILFGTRSVQGRSRVLCLIHGLTGEGPFI